MTKSTTPILDEATVAELANRDVCDHNCAMLTPTERDALCATVRALRAEISTLKAHWADTSEDLASALLKIGELQSQSEQVTKERDRFSELADKRHDELWTARRQRDDLAAKCAPYLEQLK